MCLCTRCVQAAREMAHAIIAKDEGSHERIFAENIERAIFNYTTGQ